MLPATRKKSHPTLKEVEELFCRWRQVKKHRQPIPEALWKAATSLSAWYSINEISKRLHLSYSELKAHTVSAVESIPAFVELPALCATECTIEMEKPSGERVRVRGACSITELVREFFR